MEQKVKNSQQTQANDQNSNEPSKSILIGYEELNKKLDELLIKLRSKKKKYA